MLWLFGVLLIIFYILNIFNEKKFDICQEYNINFEQVQNYIRYFFDIICDIKYMVENRFNYNIVSSDIVVGVFIKNKIMFKYYLFNLEVDCVIFNLFCYLLLDFFSNFILYWKENFVVVYDFNWIFFIGSDIMCMVDFDICNVLME